MRYGGDHKAQTRDRVLKEAAAALRADGPDRVGVAGVMSRAGLTHGGFYAHFASKDDLLAEAVDYMFADAAAAICERADGEEPLAELSRWIDLYLSMKHCGSRDRGCPIPILAGELHRLPDGARSRFGAAVRRFEDRLAGLLEQAGIADAHERAQSAMAEMIGAVSLSRVLPDTQAERLLAGARQSVRCKLGLRAPPGSSSGRSA